MPLVPWAILQLETINAIIHDLGLAQFTSRTARKNDLVKLLYSIELEGLSPVRHRLQLTADRREREESPELEYSGPAPSTPSSSANPPVRPIVEIPVHVPIFTPSDDDVDIEEDEDEDGSEPVRPRRGRRRPRTRASLIEKGKARARSSPSPSPELELEESDSLSAPSLSRVGPPTKGKGKAPASARVGRKRARPEPPAAPKLPPIDLSNVPPPSYAILYRQLNNVGKPRRTPWPRLNPREKFAGVDVPPRKRKRLREEDEDEDADEEQEGARERGEEQERERNGSASARAIVTEAAFSVDGSERLGGGIRGSSTATGTGTAASTTRSLRRRMEAVVVLSSKTPKAKAASRWQRKTMVAGDDEMDFWA